MKYIQFGLKEELELEEGRCIRPPKGSNDLEYVVRYLWLYDTHRYSLERKRVQLFLFALIAAFTSERPGTIVENSAKGIRGSGECLSYGDIELLKVRSSGLEGPSFQLCAKVQFKFKKGKRHKGEPWVAKMA